MRKPRVGKEKDQGEKREVTLHRTGVEEGIVIPTLMAWATLDPNDTSRIGYLEEVAEELSTPGSTPRAEGVAAGEIKAKQELGFSPANHSKQ
ncbi:MAG: hypothetical protein QJR13_07495 [Bacillota bacterium]|nr:hypothetical protein [Bacillota bacterium]